MMSDKTQTRITRTLGGIMLLICAVCTLALANLVMAGCSTVSGLGSLMGGLGRDIKDAAEGTRARMVQDGEHN